MSGYRTVESGKQFSIWIAIRLVGLLFYIAVDISAINKGQSLLIAVFSCFVISFVLHLVDLLLRLARMGEMQKVSR